MLLETKKPMADRPGPTPVARTAGETVPVSVLIPTLNEERNIADCLASVGFAAERIVYDSFSSDRTLDIAREAGARIEQRKFDVFSRHKNWALDNLSFAHAWILILDADERITPALEAEIRAVVANPTADAYYLPRQNFFAGRWIKHCGMYPDWQLRLFKRGSARYEDRIVHEHMLTTGATSRLKNPIRHDDYKGMERYIDRHNTYSTMEAIAVYHELSGNSGNALEASFLRPGPHRRRALKNFAYRHLPFRPALVFFYMYIVRGGILDGRTGFHYSLLRATYEFQIDLKLRELKNPNSSMRARYHQLMSR
jgi:glycosyltransferase involved in cell wall biosynthesis